MSVSVDDADLHPVDIIATALIAAWNADDGLHAIHGGDGDADLRVWREFPDQHVDTPLITISPFNYNPVSGTTTDLFRPSIQIDFFSVDPNVGGAMLSYAIKNYTIPEKLPAGLDSTGFRLSLLYCENGFGSLRYKRTSDETEIRQKPSIWAARISPIS